MLYYLGELAEWIERRLKKLREMAAEQSESASDMDEEEMKDESTDKQRGCKLLIVATADEQYVCICSGSSSNNSSCHSSSSCCCCRLFAA